MQQKQAWFSLEQHYPGFWSGFPRDAHHICMEPLCRAAPSRGCNNYPALPYKGFIHGHIFVYRAGIKFRFNRKNHGCMVKNRSMCYKGERQTVFISCPANKRKPSSAWLLYPGLFFFCRFWNGRQLFFPHNFNAEPRFRNSSGEGRELMVE